MNTDKSGKKKVQGSSAGGTVICHCFQVTDKTIEQAVRQQNLETVQDVSASIKAGGGCATCRVDIEKIIQKVRTQTPEEVSAASKESAKKSSVKLSGTDKDAFIQKVLMEQIRPLILADDGDLELVEIADKTVRVRVRSNDPDNPKAESTLLHSIVSILHELVDPDIILEDVAS